MTDIRIVNVTNLKGIWADWLLLPTGMLDQSQELANAVKVALLTDAIADPADILPDPDATDRRGWWGDLDAETIWIGLADRLQMLAAPARQDYAGGSARRIDAGAGRELCAGGAAADDRQPNLQRH